MYFERDKGIFCFNAIDLDRIVILHIAWTHLCVPCQYIALHTKRLTRGTGRHILTLITLFAAGDVDILEIPVGAAAITAENVHGHSIIADRAGDTIDSNTGDLDIVTGIASRATVLVVLLDNNTVVRDSGQLDVGVGDVADGAGLPDNGLDARAVRRIADS